MSIFKVELRRVYGNCLAFPVNDVAKNLAELEGRKTLNMDALRYIVSTGHTVEINCLSDLEFCKWNMVAELAKVEPKTIPEESK